ncbi:hypothetical protein T484DRAFT_3646257, partial [Baffinella frigidus]
KKDYVRGVIAGIGVCPSVKAFSTDAYDTLFAIVQHHPDATSKLRDIEDFYITKNKFGGDHGFTLMIKKKDGGEIDVSYLRSATGKKTSTRDVFLACLRVSVDPQIREFKDRTAKVCAICNEKLTKKTGREADHVKHFTTIVDEFIAMQPAPFTYPTETRECNDGTFRYRLTDTDKKDDTPDRSQGHAVIAVVLETMRSNLGDPTTQRMGCTIFSRISEMSEDNDRPLRAFRLNIDDIEHVVKQAAREYRGAGVDWMPHVNTTLQNIASYRRMIRRENNWKENLIDRMNRMHRMWG